MCVLMYASDSVQERTESHISSKEHSWKDRSLFFQFVTANTIEIEAVQVYLIAKHRLTDMCGRLPARLWMGVGMCVCVWNTMKPALGYQ